jgi:hypothetical protein
LVKAEMAAVQQVAMEQEVAAVADGQQKFIQRHHYLPRNHTQQGQEQILLALRP